MSSELWVRAQSPLSTPTSCERPLQASHQHRACGLRPSTSRILPPCFWRPDPSPHLRGHSDMMLMALRKPNGSLRPVAAGLRWLCSELMGSSIRSILEPIQVGVQTRAGCKSVVHTTRPWTNTFCGDPDRVLVLVDLANAFNCVSRGPQSGKLPGDDSLGWRVLPS